MYKLFFLIALTVSAPLTHASIENKDALVSLRYSTTDITNATLPVWGVGFANVNGVESLAWPPQLIIKPSVPIGVITCSMERIITLTFTLMEVGGKRNVRHSLWTYR